MPPEVKEVITGVNTRLKALGAKRLTKREVDFVLKAALAGGIKAPTTAATTAATPTPTPTPTPQTTAKPPVLPPKPTTPVATVKTGVAGGPAKGSTHSRCLCCSRPDLPVPATSSGANWRQTVKPGQMQNSAELQRLRDQIQQKDTKIIELESNVRTLEAKTRQIEGEVKQLRDRASSSSDDKLNLEKQISELKADKAKSDAMMSTQRQTLSSPNFSLACLATF